MKKNVKQTNIRLDAPLGRLGVPPDAGAYLPGCNVLILAQLSPAQFDALCRCLRGEKTFQGGVTS